MYVDHAVVLLLETRLCSSVSSWLIPKIGLQFLAMPSGCMDILHLQGNILLFQYHTGEQQSLTKLKIPLLGKT